MTTRCLITVKNNNEWSRVDIKWCDGYPEYEGKKLLKALKRNIKKFQKNNIHKFENTLQELVKNTASRWVYVIDFDKQQLEIYSINQPLRSKYSIKYGKKELKELYFIEKFDLTNLPDEKTFLGAISERFIPNT